MEKEEKPMLESATFRFSQEANCLSNEDEYEDLVIEVESSLGIDRDEGCFFVLKTEKWSIDSGEDLTALIDRIKAVVLKQPLEGGQDGNVPVC